MKTGCFPEVLQQDYEVALVTQKECLMSKDLLILRSLSQMEESYYLYLPLVKMELKMQH